VLQAVGHVYLNGKTAKSNDMIFPSSHVIVSNGFSVVDLSAFGTLRLYKDTEVSVLLHSNVGSVKMKSGKVWSVINKMAPENHFEVLTPNSVCGVRGTEFVVEATKDRSKCGVIKGVVKMENKKGQFQILTNNTQTEILKDDAPAKPVYYNAALEIGLWEFIVKLINGIFNPSAVKK
jgi:hypothetical protein